MQKKSVRAAAVAVAATFAIGVTAPSSLAAPHAHHATAHGKSAHTKSAHAKSAHTKGTHDHSPAQQHRLDRAQAKTAHEAARKARAIAGFMRDKRFHGIAADVVTAVKANAALDITDLNSYADQARAAGTVDDVRTVAAKVHALRPEGYRILEDALRHAAALQQQADAAGQAAVSAQVDAAVQKAEAYRAADPKSTLRSIRADLDAAAQALAAVTPAPTTGTSDGSGDTTTPPAA